MNILDYLDWRGDLPFAASRLNEVDALIFTWLTYYRFEDLEAESFSGMTLEQLAKLHEQVHGPFQKINPTTTIDPAVTSTWVLHQASGTNRFGQVRLCDFTRKESAEDSAGTQGGQAMQFAAVTFLIKDGEGDCKVVAYRGTDDSIAGWKEDFYLAISEKVPVQETALSYLCGMADGHRMVVCGHSKGGNMALYAALFAPEDLRKHLSAVYNFDGPGFCFDMRTMDSYREMQDRITTIVPESSVVGMLLEHEEDYSIVESKAMGILQHDALFWQVLGNHFVYADKRNESSLIADRAIKGWIDGMSIQERQEFVDALFGVLEGTGAVRTSELPGKFTEDGFRNLIHVPLSGQQKKMLVRVLLNLIKSGNASLYETLMRTLNPDRIIGIGSKQ